MRRRYVLKLAGSSIAIAMLLDRTSQRQNSANLVGENPGLSTSLPSSTKSISAEVSVDWATQQAQTTPLTFGSNDYEITTPETARDPVYQHRLAKLGIG